MAESEETIEEAQSSRTIHRWKTADGLFHRQEGPAYTRLFRGKLEVECWMLNHEVGRADDGPTAISHLTKDNPKPTDRIRTEFWLTGPLGTYFDYPANQQNPRHRDDGPAVIGYYPNGAIRIQEWWVDGERHRDGGAAVLNFSLDGNVTGEEFFVRGRRPAMVKTEYFDDGSPKREIWLSDEAGLHRVDGPALFDRHPDGSPKTVEYYVDGVMSRTDGPAAIEYFPNTNHENGEASPYLEQWRTHDRLHRDDGPAITVWHPNGVVAETQWWTDGNRRAEGGPAIERWSPDGELTDQVTWKNPPDGLPDGQYLRRHGEYERWQEESETLVLRRWHRWQLGLEGLPEDAAFTNSWWLVQASLAELRSRLSYFPNGDDIADRVMQWREQRGRDDTSTVDHEVITRAFVRFLQPHIRDSWRPSFEQGASGPITIVSETPEAGEDESRLIDALDFVLDEISVPYILNETIYNASGNHFLPIYWLTQPLHGVDVTAWADFFDADLAAVIGPDGIRVGPRDF